MRFSRVLKPLHLIGEAFLYLHNLYLLHRSLEGRILIAVLSGLAAFFAFWSSPVAVPPLFLGLVIVTRKAGYPAVAQSEWLIVLTFFLWWTIWLLLVTIAGGKAIADILSQIPATRRESPPRMHCI